MNEEYQKQDEPDKRGIVATTLAGADEFWGERALTAALRSCVEPAPKTMNLPVVFAFPTMACRLRMSFSSSWEI